MDSILKYTNIEEAFVVLYDYNECRFCSYDIHELMNIKDKNYLFIKIDKDQIDISTDLNFISYTEKKDYNKKNTKIWSGIVLKRNFVTDFIKCDYNNCSTMNYNIFNIVKQICNKNINDNSQITLKIKDEVIDKKLEEYLYNENDVDDIDYINSYLIIKHKRDKKIYKDEDENQETYFIKQINEKHFKILNNNKILYTVFIINSINSDPASKIPSSDDGVFDTGMLLYYQCPKINIKDIDTKTNNRIALKPIIDLKKYTGLCLCPPQNETYSYSFVIEENSLYENNENNEENNEKLKNIENYKDSFIK